MTIDTLDPVILDGWVARLQKELGLLQSSNFLFEVLLEKSTNDYTTLHSQHQGLLDRYKNLEDRIKQQDGQIVELEKKLSELLPPNRTKIPRK